MQRFSRTRTKPANREIKVDLATIDPTFWTQGFDLDPVAWDQLSVVNGYITCADPDSGPNNSALFGAYHGCCFHDFGAGWEDNFEIEIEWSAMRPMEAAGLMHVNTGTTGFGAGLWPSYFGAGNGFWLTGQIGDSNATIVLDPSGRLLDEAEDLKYSMPWRVSPPVSIIARCASGKYTWCYDGTWINNLTFDTPAALVGSTTHGFAIDGNLLDGAFGAGGFRPPNWPAITANSFTIRKL